MGHMNIKRVSKRIYEELKSTYEVAKVTSWKDALNTFLGKVDIQIMVHNGRIECEWIKKQLLKKHKVMNKYFSKLCGDFNEDEFAVPKQDDDLHDCIWICWWQGEDNAPDIVKKCIQSIRNNAGDHKVIVITDQNFHEYVQFPEWINEKKNKGIITKTHISDILRLQLLAQYGGLWLDSTFFCTHNLEYCFDVPVWSIKRPDYKHVSVACGNFANYSFACNTENRKVFAIILSYLLQYWKKFDYMIDYLFLDYLIVQAQQNNEYVSKCFLEIPSNNPCCDDLLSKMNCSFEIEEWKMLKKDTNLFKLSWKPNFKEYDNTEPTFYKVLFTETNCEMEN